MVQFPQSDNLFLQIHLCVQVITLRGVKHSQYLLYSQWQKCIQAYQVVWSCQFFPWGKEMEYRKKGNVFAAAKVAHSILYDMHV